MMFDRPTTQEGWDELAVEFEAEAHKCWERRDESWERSDTDGFLSQAASQAVASLNMDKAGVCRAGGMAEFWGLYEGDRRVKARIIDGKYGSSWLLHEDEAELIEKRGKKFLPMDYYGKSRIHKQLGLTTRGEMAPAWVASAGFNGGYRFRVGCKWGQDATPTKED